MIPLGQFSNQQTFHKYSHEYSTHYERRGPVGKTTYLSLVNEDLCYYGNFDRMKSLQFKVFIKKIVFDLNLLLHFRYEDFWEEINTSSSLRRCLSSCLQIFPRKRFGVYVSKQSSKSMELNLSLQDLHKNEAYFLFNKLIKTVLLIYYRMLCQSNEQQKRDQYKCQQEKQIIYSQWILDVPKMFNLISIYKHSNNKILKQILKSAFVNIQEYETDVQDFIRFVSRQLLESLQLDLKYQYTEAIISKSTHYGNPILSFTRNLVKSFFRIFDTYSVLLDFLKYFPFHYTIEIFKKKKIIIELIKGYFSYMENITRRWEMTKQFRTKFGMVIEAVRQRILQFLIEVFRFMKLTLQKQEDDKSWMGCLKTYSGICKQFAFCSLPWLKQQWQCLIKIVIKSSKKQVFIVKDYFCLKLQNQELEGIKKCRLFEQRYRRQINPDKFSDLQVFELKLEHIQSFNDWEVFNKLQASELQLDIAQQIQLNTPNTSAILSQDSILAIQTQISKAKNYSQTSQLPDKSKYHLFNYDDYNDEPVENWLQDRNNLIVQTLQPDDLPENGSQLDQTSFYEK